MGGPSGFGTVYKIDAAGALTTLHGFNFSDGVDPDGALIQASDGALYGTTSSGGAANRGTVFKVDAAGVLTTLHSFNGSDGANPRGAAIQAIDGSFYGTTETGGASNSGVVFRLTVELPTTTTLTVSPSPSMVGQSVTLTARVTIGRATPTGSVAFFDGSTLLGTAMLTAGTAALRTTTLTSGSHTLRAEYAGVTNFAPSTSDAVTHIVVLPATFISPADHATNVDLTQQITWTAVSGAEAYYLYLGTSPGAKDIVNSGELHVTSYQVVSAAANVTLYARLWTKVGGSWRYVDITFTTNALRFIYPAPSVTSADLGQPFQWAVVSNAQAYYLYVGSAVGLKDLLNSGELQATSYLAANLPINQPLYVRLWVRAGGGWSYIDRIVTGTATVQRTAQFINPVNGATTVDLGQPIQWTTVADAQAYYLYVGSSLGARDLLNSGELTTTSYLAPNLPLGQLLYARLWTKVAGGWRYVDITFTATSGGVLHFTYPAAGVTWVDSGEPLQWAPVANAQAYYLYLGTTAGGKDLVNTGELHTTSYLAVNVPLNRPLYVRLWVKVANAWSYIDRLMTWMPAGTTIIGFNALTNNGSPVSSYSESGFSVSATSASWQAVTTYGHPAPFLESSSSLVCLRHAAVGCRGWQSNVS